MGDCYNHSPNPMLGRLPFHSAGSCPEVPHRHCTPGDSMPYREGPGRPPDGRPRALFKQRRCQLAARPAAEDLARDEAAPWAAVWTQSSQPSSSCFVCVRPSPAGTTVGCFTPRQAQVTCRFRRPVSTGYSSQLSLRLENLGNIGQYILEI